MKVISLVSGRLLWGACLEASWQGGAGLPARGQFWLWLSHRNLRDRLLETAQAQGHPGWLDPPISFFGDLTNLFDVREKPVGLLMLIPAEAVH